MGCYLLGEPLLLGPLFDTHERIRAIPELARAHSRSGPLLRATPRNWRNTFSRVDMFDSLLAQSPF